MKKAKLSILNLVSDLSENVKSFFQESEITLLSKNELEKEYKYILFEDESQIKEISTNFDIAKTGVELITLGNIKDVKNFLLNNGKLIIREELIHNEVYSESLKNFFCQFTSVHLDELYPNQFDEFHQFDLSDHASVGQLTDELALIATNRGFNPVTVRTYLDHLIYYFSYLKQAGLAHVPFEVECGFNSESMAIEVHTTMRNFVSEYLIDSFGDINSSDPLQFLLGIIQKSCDFLHINYIEENTKLALVGIWNKSSSLKSTSIAFQNIYSTEEVLKDIELKVQNYKEINVREEAKEVNLPGNLLEMILPSSENSIFSKDDKLASNLVAFVIGRFEEENPDTSIQSEKEDVLINIIKAYPDKALLEKLDQADIDHIVNRVKKNHIAKAYQDEIERVREQFYNDDEYKKTLGNTFEDEVIEKIKGHFDVEAINRILGSKDKADEVIHVEGEKDASEFVQKIKGVADKKDDFIARLSKSFEEKATLFDFDKIENSKKKEKVKDFLSESSHFMLGKSELNPSVKEFLKQKIPRSLEIGFERFIKARGLSVEELTNQDVERFQVIAMPQIISEFLSNENEVNDYEKKIQSGFDIPLKPFDEKGLSFSQDLESSFKTVLENNLKKLNEYRDASTIKVSDLDVKNPQVNKVIEKSLREVLKPNFEFETSSKEEILQKEEALIVELSRLIPNKNTEVSDSVKEVTNDLKSDELKKVLENLFLEQKRIEDKEALIQKNESDLAHEKAKVRSMAENELVKRLKKSQEENKRLLQELQALKVNNESRNVADSKVDALKEVAKSHTEAIHQKNFTVNEEVEIASEEKEKLLKDIQEGRELSHGQQELINDLIEHEKFILQKEKDTELFLRKNKIENNQRENLFKQELEKANKLAASKDLILQKAKESMKALVSKKEVEIQGLNKKMQDLLKKIADDKTTIMEKEIMSLKQDNENLGRMADVYKNKLSAMAKTMMKNQQKDESKLVEDKNRELTRVKNQLENNLNSELRKNKIIQDKLETAKEQERDLRTELNRLTHSLKEAQANLSGSKEEGAGEALKSSLLQQQKFQQQNAALSLKVKELEEKLKEVVSRSVIEQNNSLNQSPSSAKEKQLETQTKKLNSELSKAKGMIVEEKKNFVKLKAENTALKNQLSKLKKDMAKLETVKNTKKAA